MEFGPVVSFRKWKYQKGGIVLRNFNHVSDAWVKVTRDRVVFRLECVVERVFKKFITDCCTHLLLKGVLIFQQITKGTDDKCQHGVRLDPGPPLNKAVVSTTAKGETSVKTENTTQSKQIRLP